MATHFSILAGESQGQRSLVGNSPWSCKESDTTKATYHTGKHIVLTSGNNGAISVTTQSASLE